MESKMPIVNEDYSNINYEEMAESIGLKSKHIPILITSFLNESDSIMNNIKEAIDSKNYEKIKTNAHSIKGSAGNLKFNKIYDMAKEVEKSASLKSENFDYNGYLKAIKKIISTISN
ncbi:MAG: Hpt domain-containing protein [Sulfurimonas sp.]|nr:Hpt domain-containing protein [Sulfurimonas sp.]